MAFRLFYGKPWVGKDGNVYRYAYMDAKYIRDSRRTLMIAKRWEKA